MPGFRITGSEVEPSISNDVEYHRDHRWIINNFGFPSSVGSGLDTLKYHAKSITLPELSFDEINPSGASLNYKIASRARFDAVTVKMYDIYGLHQIFADWQDLMWTPEDGLKPANDYKGNTVFSLTDGKGMRKRRYELVGAYPKHVSHTELSYSSSKIKLLTIAYSFDYMKIDLSKDIQPSDLISMGLDAISSLPAFPTPF